MFISCSVKRDEIYQLSTILSNGRLEVSASDNKFHQYVIKIGSILLNNFGKMLPGSLSTETSVYPCGYNCSKILRRIISLVLSSDGTYKLKSESDTNLPTINQQIRTWTNFQLNN